MFASTFIATAMVVTGAFAASSIVVDPPITSPTASTVWTIGSTQNVTWDTTGIPAGAGNQTGLLLLGFESNGSENLDINNPLANQFAIGAGFVEVTVPAVVGGDNYIVVLFGDSGNVSPEFTISS